MKLLTELSNEEARQHFLKGSSYFNGDFPNYISFEPILQCVAEILNGKGYASMKAEKPDNFSGINYSFVANKDGRFAWRPYELIHPAIYVSLVNQICEPAAWENIKKQLKKFQYGAVTCCSLPVLSVDDQSDQAAQIRSWWQSVEQRSLVYSLKFSHLLHTDVIDCYGSLYTHSISWALHGLDTAKENKGNGQLLGNRIDGHIRASRFGQTNGIAQGSALMDFVAEIVLGYVDQNITDALGQAEDVKILRYRDDYRVFANSDDRAELVLKIISDKLRDVGMKLGVSKTLMHTNVVEGSIKPDKLAGIYLQDLGDGNAKTIQKQLLRLHAFGRRFPNSGALRRLTSELHTKISKNTDVPDDLDVQVAIATDIAFVSPQTFPAIAGILSHLISLASKEDKKDLWDGVRAKMRRVPYNGYLEIWLQRVTKPKEVAINFQSDERICKIVNGQSPELWENGWIASKDLKAALGVEKIVVGDASETSETIPPEEIELFTKYAWAY